MSRYNLKKTPHDEGANREKAPTGYYTFQVTDYKEKDKEGNYYETANGDPKILAICEIVDGDHAGKSALQNVIFYKPDSKGVKGIGMTRHFLKCIEQPWEDDLDATPDDWIGKRFKAEVIHKDGYANLVEIQACDQGDTVKPEKEVSWDG